MNKTLLTKLGRLEKNNRHRALHGHTRVRAPTRTGGHGHNNFKISRDGTGTGLKSITHAELKHNHTYTL